MPPPGSLPNARREAFSALLIAARHAAGLSLSELAQKIYERLPGDEEPVPKSWPTDMERAPPHPLANVPRLNAALEVLGVEWREVLAVIGADCKSPNQSDKEHK